MAGAQVTLHKRVPRAMRKERESTLRTISKGKIWQEGQHTTAAEIGDTYAKERTENM
jgi:hypothetical protein